MSTRNDNSHAIRLTRAITEAVLEASISPDGGSIIMAQDTVHALIANIAMILAASPSASTKKGLREYSEYVAKRVREETILLRADPNMNSIKSETVAGEIN
jgi:hypothetical protein